jgi:calcineurin-like phosphoesterase family protein
MFDFDQVDFVTADTHFGHARINELAQRPFASTDEMNRALILRWNRVVGHDDVVLHLGDLALGPIEESLALTEQLNGRKFLVPGNHDRVSTATQSKKAVERFTPLYQRHGWTILPEVVEGTRHGRALLASHYPYHGDSQGTERHFSPRPRDAGLPLIHGHTHSRDHGPDGTQFHVGVDAFDYAPIPLALIDDWLARLQRETNTGGA